MGIAPNPARFGAHIDQFAPCSSKTSLRLGEHYCSSIVQSSETPLSGQETIYDTCQTCLKASCMKPGIRFTRIWADDEMPELQIEICDGRSLFVSEIYVGIIY